MELLKVFVGDGDSAGTAPASMIKGDLALLNATDYTPWTSGNDAVIAGKNDNGVFFSAPIKASKILYSSYKTYSAATQKVMNVGFGFSSVVADHVSKTFTLGVQIKEDLRMGTYNKNTEILASHVCPSTAYSDIPTLLADMSSNIAKGFAANPLTSAGSPSQLVKVERTTSITKTSLAIATETFTFTKGSRMVTIGTDQAAAFPLGRVLSVGQGTGTYDAVYIVEKAGVYDSVADVTTFYLDTAYQGESSTNLVATGTTVGTTVGFLSGLTGLTVAGLDFKVTGVAQSRTNRYDQSRIVDFVVVSPKGFEGPNDITTTVATSLSQGSGLYSQVRDLEEKAYTNTNPLINYREFPFQDFALNATSGTNYNIFTVTYTNDSGYNLSQSNNKEFVQTVVVCAPGIATKDFDSGTAGKFAARWNAFAGSPHNKFTDL